MRVPVSKTKLGSVGSDLVKGLDGLMDVNMVVFHPESCGRRVVVVGNSVMGINMGVGVDCEVCVFLTTV